MKKRMIKLFSILYCVLLMNNIPIYATNIENDNNEINNVDEIITTTISITPTIVNEELSPTPTPTIEENIEDSIITPTPSIALNKNEDTNEHINNTNDETIVEEENVENVDNNITNTLTPTPTIVNEELSPTPTIVEKEEMTTYTIEDYIGENYEKVVNELKEKNIIPIITFEENNNYPVNVIFHQNIEPNTIFDESETLQLLVSNGPILNDIETVLVDSKLNKKQTNSFGLSSTNSSKNIVIDGNFDDWNDKPYSFEFNWDNSDSCWYNGVWLDENTCYKVPIGTYDTNVRHLMQLYSDGEYLYLHIIFAKNYFYFQNGNDYQFYIDGEMAAFQLETMNRETIANYYFPIGIQELLVSHRNSSMSYSQVINSKAYITTYNDKNINNEMELMIPLSELQRQNNNINLENIGVIEYFCPNLMYKNITCAGTDTGAIIFILLSISVCTFIYFKTKKCKQ